MRTPKIINVSETGASGWNWIGGKFEEDPFDWQSFSGTPSSNIERLLIRPKLGRYRACWQAVNAAKQTNAVLLVTHQPLIAAWCAAMGRMIDLRTPQLAFAFTFSQLPSGSRLAMMKRAFQHIDRFVSFSTIERRRYAQIFDIPVDRIDTLRWSVAQPSIDLSEQPIEDGEYLCAIGGEGRDYATLVDAMRGLPDLRLAIVARPQNVEGLDLPPNVSVRTNITLKEVWNIGKHAKLMVLPLLDTQVPCGHGTLIMAMQLKTPCIVTESDAMSDYVYPGKTALVCPPSRPQALASTICRLWEDQALADSIVKSAHQFATAECSEARTIKYFLDYAERLNLR